MSASPSRPALKPGSGLNSIPAYNFIFAEGGINLPPAQSSIYAMIYQFSQNSVGYYFGSLTHTCGQCGITRRGAVKALHALLEAGWIAEVGIHRQGSNRNTKKYMAVADKAHEALDAYDKYWRNKTREWEDYKDNVHSEQAIVENYVSGELCSPETSVENPSSGEPGSPDQVYRVPPNIKNILKNNNPTIQPTSAVGSPEQSCASIPSEERIAPKDEMLSALRNLAFNCDCPQGEEDDLETLRALARRYFDECNGRKESRGGNVCAREFKRSTN